MPLERERYFYSPSRWKIHRFIARYRRFQTRILFKDYIQTTLDDDGKKNSPDIWLKNYKSAPSASDIQMFFGITNEDTARLREWLKCGRRGRATANGARVWLWICNIRGFIWVYRCDVARKYKSMIFRQSASRPNKQNNVSFFARFSLESRYSLTLLNSCDLNGFSSANESTGSRVE